MKSVVVFGLGQFGKSLALSLSKAGADVMAVDRDEEIVASVAPHVTYAAVADLGNADAIAGLGLSNMDIAVVAVASDLSASILSVVISKEMGIPYVIAKASGERMGVILKRTGADRIIYPEAEMGERTARVLMSNDFLEYFDIDDNLCIVEMKPKKEWIGKSLKQLNLRERYSINVAAVKSHNEMRSSIDPNKPLKENSDLLIITERDNLKNLNRNQKPSR
ncbi:MAG: TrkA family potassium uptake protein [Oscillospiraceae bacterium]|nr:TrkA family potassium uptake protein [Oscillospiraceae bacterium]